MSPGFPRLYAILDSALVSSREPELAVALAEAGTGMIQYRNKGAVPRQVLEISRLIAKALHRRSVCFIVNDRADIAVLAEAGGVHAGQDDLDVSAACEVFECAGVAREGFKIGVSTHTLDQVRAAEATGADYIAFGPIFDTATKVNPGTAAGAKLLSEARKLTRKPLVAIGGITVGRAAEVYSAGADCVAVAKDLAAAENPARRAAQYLEVAASVLD